MPDTKARFEDMLFNYETVTRTDFRDGKIRPTTKTVFKEKPRCLMIRPPPLKNIHTVTDWKEVVPFSLVHKPKDIVRTNPWAVQKPYSKPVDELRGQVQATRPRLVMTPAVSMDDIGDDTVRKILCDAMYTSDMTHATREAVSDYFSVRAPLPDLPAPASPIYLPKVKPSYVSPEWRMESVKWDREQLRAHCLPTEEFWIRQPNPVCMKCEESAVVTANRKMKQ